MVNITSEPAAAADEKQTSGNDDAVTSIGEQAAEPWKVDKNNVMDTLRPDLKEDPEEHSLRLRGSIRKSNAIFKLKGYQAAIETAFDDLDLNKNGVLERSEIRAFMEEAARHVRLEVEADILDAAVDALIEDVGGEDSDHCINRSQFLDIFQRLPDLLTAFGDAYSSDSIRSQGLSEAEIIEEIREEERENEQEQVWTTHHAHTEWKNRGKAMLWLGLYFAGNVAAFTKKGVEYNQDEEAQAVFGNCIIVARGCAKCLNLNAFLILIPVCRHFMTRFRLIGFARFLFPFDVQLEFHMLVGAMIFIFAASHTLAHMCDFTRFARADEEDILALFGWRQARSYSRR
jgi:respiratory burst oxidase